jgi:hypothetical protein
MEPMADHPEDTPLDEEDIAQLAQIFDLLAQWDWEQKERERGPH